MGYVFIFCDFEIQSVECKRLKDIKKGEKINLSKSLTSGYVTGVFKKLRNQAKNEGVVFGRDFRTRLKTQVLS